MNVLATIVKGEVDWADVLLLIAVIVFAIATVASIARSAVEAALVPAGLTALALAFLVL